LFSLIIIQFFNINTEYLIPKLNGLHNSFSKIEKGNEIGNQLNAMTTAIQTRNFMLLILAGLSISPFLLFSTVIIKKFKKYRNKQSELIGKNKNKDLFFSIISHDLKTPALNLISLSDLAIKGNELDAKEHQRINHLINTSAKKHYELLVNLLDWSKTQFNESEVSKSLCNVYQIVQNAISYHQESAILKEIVIENKIPDDLTLFSNESMLAALFRNLLSNAIKFSKTGGGVLIDVTCTDQEFIIKVEDQGVGMSTETIKNLFNINYIRSLRGTSKEVGSGLGLILCREIVNQLDGKIVVFSKENCGTKFLIRLPIEN
jgi:signal transduction histidine kinase